MGLDCYWGTRRPHGYTESPDEVLITRIEDRNELDSLCIMDYTFPNSFRGKLYSDWIQAITEETLYQEYIPPESVAEMARLLDRAKYMDALRQCGPYPPSGPEFTDIKTMFNIYSKYNGALYGNW